jgi:phage terminase large subunit
LIEVIYNQGEVYLRERLWTTGYTNDMIYDEIKDIVKNELVIADSAEQKSIQEINNLGLYIDESIKGPDSIRYGIKLMHGYKLNIHKDSLHLLDEFRSYKWLVTRNGDQTGKPVDNWNHGIDPIRYCLVSRINSMEIDENYIS